MDEILYAQAVGYEHRLRGSFEKSEAVEVSPLASDGAMACMFAMIASRKVRVLKRFRFSSPLAFLFPAPSRREVG